MGMTDENKPRFSLRLPIYRRTVRSRGRAAGGITSPKTDSSILVNGSSRWSLPRKVAPGDLGGVAPMAGPLRLSLSLPWPISLPLSPFLHPPAPPLHYTNPDPLDQKRR
eukprot:4692199-Pyramimonas_sp.AAC.1